MKMEKWAKAEISDLVASAYAEDNTRQRNDVVRIVTDQIKAWRDDLKEYLEEIGPEYVVETEVASYNRATRRRISLEVEGGQDPIPGILPEYEVVRKMRANFYGADGFRVDKPVPTCSIDDIKATVDYYADQRRSMAKYEAYFLFIYDAMREADLSSGQTVADLYRLFELKEA